MRIAVAQLCVALAVAASPYYDYYGSYPDEYWHDLLHEVRSSEPRVGEYTSNCIRLPYGPASRRDYRNQRMTVYCAVGQELANYDQEGNLYIAQDQDIWFNAEEDPYFTNPRPFSQFDYTAGENYWEDYQGRWEDKIKGIYPTFAQNWYYFEYYGDGDDGEDSYGDFVFNGFDNRWYAPDHYYDDYPFSVQKPYSYSMSDYVYRRYPYGGYANEYAPEVPRQGEVVDNYSEGGYDYDHGTLGPRFGFPYPVDGGFEFARFPGEKFTFNRDNGRFEEIERGEPYFSRGDRYFEQPQPQSAYAYRSRYDFT